MTDKVAETLENPRETIWGTIKWLVSTTYWTIHTRLWIRKHGMWFQCQNKECGTKFRTVPKAGDFLPGCPHCLTDGIHVN